MSAPTSPPRRFLALALAGLLLGSAAGLVAWRLRSSVEQALETEPGTRRPLSFVALPPRAACRRAGAARTSTRWWCRPAVFTAGGSGVLQDGQARPELALPTLRVVALADWRGRLVAAPAAGGVYRRADREWQELRSGFGKLNVRALAETPAGELLLGAREGLFRAAHGAVRLERLDTHPVRALVPGGGFVLAGGEQGLFRVQAGRVTPLATPDPWIEALALDGREPVGGDGGGAGEGRWRARSRRSRAARTWWPACCTRGTSWAWPSPRRPRSRASAPTAACARSRCPPRRGACTSRRERSSPTRWPVSSGADPTAGCRPRRRTPALPGERSHIGALARLDGRVVAGLFDGGLLVREPEGGWALVPGSEAWGVNALMPAGGELYVASLRGAARFDGHRLRALEGPGAAFSLAATEQGVAVGYGQGVLLPGGRLLSAFHGLPGNQALALAAARPALYVGTPSGLGAIEERRVRWQVGPGEGRLPNGWVTALAVSGEALYVGTYGGGIVRRLPAREADRQARAGRFEPFVETEGLKINTGCLVEAAGRLYAGSDGRGLYRLSLDGRRFEPVAAALPSPRVTALLARARRAAGRHRRRPHAAALRLFRHRGALMSTRLLKLGLALACLAPSAPLLAQAGLLVPTSSGRPDPAVLSLREMEIQVGLARGYARVSVRQVFENHTGRIQEGTYRFRAAALGRGGRLRGLGRPHAHPGRDRRKAPGAGHLPRADHAAYRPGPAAAGRRGRRRARRAIGARGAPSGGSVFSVTRGAHPGPGHQAARAAVPAGGALRGRPGRVPPGPASARRRASGGRRPARARAAGRRPVHAAARRPALDGP